MNDTNLPDDFHVIIDGSNFAFRQRTRNRLNLSWMLKVVDAIKRLFPGHEVIILMDSSVWGKARGMNAKQLQILETMRDKGRLSVAPPQIGADRVILQAARDLGAIVVTNDSFHDHPNLRKDVPLLRVAEISKKPYASDTLVVFHSDSRRDYTEHPLPKIDMRRNATRFADSLHERLVATGPDPINLSRLIEIALQEDPDYQSDLQRLEGGDEKGRMLRFLERYPSLFALTHDPDGPTLVCAAEEAPSKKKPARKKDRKSSRGKSEKRGGRKKKSRAGTARLIETVRSCLEALEGKSPVNLSLLAEELRRQDPASDTALERVVGGGRKGRLARFLGRHKDHFELVPQARGFAVQIASPQKESASAVARPVRQRDDDYLDYLDEVGFQYALGESLRDLGTSPAPLGQLAAEMLQRFTNYNDALEVFQLEGEEPERLRLYLARHPTLFEMHPMGDDTLGVALVASTWDDKPVTDPPAEATASPAPETPPPPEPDPKEELLLAGIAQQCLSAAETRPVDLGVFHNALNVYKTALREQIQQASGLSGRGWFRKFLARHEGLFVVYTGEDGHQLVDLPPHPASVTTPDELPVRASLEVVKSSPAPDLDWEEEDTEPDIPVGTAAEE